MCPSPALELSVVRRPISPFLVLPQDLTLRTWALEAKGSVRAVKCNLMLMFSLAFEPDLSYWSDSRAHPWGDSLESCCLVRGRSLLLCARVSLLQGGSAQKVPVCLGIHSFIHLVKKVGLAPAVCRALWRQVNLESENLSE